MMDLALVVCAFHNFALAVFHLFFPSIFDWPRKLASLDPVNHGIVLVMNLALCFILTGVAAFCGWLLVAGPVDRSARYVLFGIAAFWTFRGILQPIYWGLAHIGSRLLFGVFILAAGAHFAAAMLA